MDIMSPRPSPADSVRSSGASSIGKALPVAKAKGTAKSLQQRPKTDKPKRPLSAYNLFFQYERDRLLRGIESPFGYNHDSLHCTLGRDPAQRANRSKRVRPPPHGKIGFAELAKKIGLNWKSLNGEGRGHFEERAAAEKIRYKGELEIWKSRRAQGFNAGTASTGTTTSPPSPTASSCSGTLAPPMVITPPNGGSESGDHHRRLPPLPPPVVGYGGGSIVQYQQPHGQRYYSIPPPPPPPLSYGPQHRPQQQEERQLEQKQQSSHSWFDWSCSAAPAPQLSSMALTNPHTYSHQPTNYYSFQQQDQRAQQQGATYYMYNEFHHEQRTIPHLLSQQEQNASSSDSEKRDADGEQQNATDFFDFPLPEIAEPDPLAQLPPEGGKLLVSDSALQQPSLTQSFAPVDNPKDMLDFLSELVCNI